MAPVVQLRDTLDLTLTLELPARDSDGWPLRAVPADPGAAAAGGAHLPAAGSNGRRVSSISTWTPWPSCGWPRSALEFSGVKLVLPAEISDPVDLAHRGRRAAAGGRAAVAHRHRPLRPVGLARRQADQPRGVPGAGTLVAAAGAAGRGVAGALGQVAAASQIDGGGGAARIEPARADRAGSGAGRGVRPARPGSHGRPHRPARSWSSSPSGCPRPSCRTPAVAGEGFHGTLRPYQNVGPRLALAGCVELGLGSAAGRRHGPGQDRAADRLPGRSLGSGRRAGADRRPDLGARQLGARGSPVCARP